MKKSDLITEAEDWLKANRWRVERFTPDCPADFEAYETYWLVEQLKNKLEKQD